MAQGSNDRLLTGVPGLDEITGGGLTKNRLYLVQGEPGTGKTTLALQYLLEGVRQKESCLYITFSETKEELISTASSHGWTLDGIHLFELSALEARLKPESQTTLFHPSEVELNETTEILIEEVKRIKPKRVVFDSASEMRLMAETSLRYRRQLLALKQFFSQQQSTVFFLDDLTAPQGEFQIQSIVHGVISLEKLQPVYGVERRRIRISKLRGSKFREGNHDCIIATGGLRVFPRMVIADQAKDFKRETISSGIRALDDLLGGGLDRGTSNLFLGPAGTGKSTLALQYAHAAAERGEKVAIFSFEENIPTVTARAKAMNLDFTSFVDQGTVKLQKVDPAELAPGEFTGLIKDLVQKDGFRMVVIDSLSGYLHSMPEEKNLMLQLHELLSFLNHQGVVTLMVLAQQGVIATQMQAPIDLTYLADTVVITRFFETMGAVKKAVSVIKKRTGPHETTIRELRIKSSGVSVGEPLKEFHGVLTGTPEYRGSKGAIMSTSKKTQSKKGSKRKSSR